MINDRFDNEIKDHKSEIEEAFKTEIGILKSQIKGINDKVENIEKEIMNQNFKKEIRRDNKVKGLGKHLDHISLYF